MASPSEEDRTESKAGSAGRPDASAGNKPTGQRIAGQLTDDTTASQEMIVPIADQSGRRLAHFQVQDRLGAGAMSSVYRAIDERDNTEVALKILLPGADSVARSRFQQEARTARQLEHLHIIRTFEVGEAESEGMAFISMELVEGESLADLLERNRQLSIFDTCLILERIARALDYAHRQGIVHRDVKPSNILLRQAAPETLGSVELSVYDHPVLPLLSDFGIARALDVPELTSVGRTVGTPSYMAPEQCSGGHTIDGRADLYSLGTVFYRSLVGRPPYVGTTTQVLYAHVYSPLMIPDEVLVNLPMPVIDILRRSLMKEPQQRYATAAAMAIEMARITGGVQSSPIEGAVDMDELTATMTALPATERTTSSSTILVPSRTSANRSPLQTGAEVTPLSRQGLASAGQRTGSRRELRRVSMGIGLALTVLVVILAVAAVRGLNPASGTPDTVAEATSAAASADVGTADGGDKAVDGDEETAVEPDANGDKTDGNTLPIPPEPTSAQASYFVAESAWIDAEYLYIDRDWPGTRDRLIQLLRTDTEFDQQLTNYVGLPTQLINQVFFQNPDYPFWQTHADLFDSDMIETMLFESLVGLAAHANARNQSDRALDYLGEALILRPGADEIAALAEATKAFTDATTGQIPGTRKGLSGAHASFAAAAAKEGRYCPAADHLETAMSLGADVNADMNTELSRYQNLCADTIAVESEQAALAQLSGRILYSTLVEDRNQIYATQIAPEAIPTLILEDAAHPVRSPDGNRMTFFSAKRENLGLSAIDVSGLSDPKQRGQRLTKYIEDGRDGPATWSVDRDQIAFSSTREGDRQSRIYVGWIGDRDSSEMIGFGVDPAWRPGRDWIVHSGTDQTGNRPGLWLRRSDGTDGEQLTTIGTDVRPTWSPDGSQIFFTSDGRDGNWEIYRLDMGEATVTRVTDHAGQDVAPTVSPDGRNLAFLSDRDGDWSIWIVDLDDGTPMRLAAIAGELSNWRDSSLQWLD